MKVCTSCSVEQPLANFWLARNGRTRDGYKNECKECAKARRRAWAAQNRDREALYNRRRYEQDPQRYIDYGREWRDANLERSREIGRMKEGARRARKRDAFIEHVDPVVLYAAHGGCCGICKEYVAPNDFHVDHIVPLALGGGHGYINVQPAHPRCNLTKGARC